MSVASTGGPNASQQVPTLNYKEVAPSQVNQTYLTRVKDLLGSFASQTTLLGQTAKLALNLGIGATRIASEWNRQEALLKAHQDMHYDLLAQGASKEQHDALASQYQPQADALAKEIGSNVKTAVEDMAHDLVDHDSVLRKLPGAKQVVAVYDIGNEVNNVRLAHNEKRQAEGNLMEFDHTKTLIGKPLTSDELHKRADLRTKTLETQVKFNNQVADSSYKVFKSVVSLHPRGDLASPAFQHFENIRNAGKDKSDL
jgi:hypothetical protein